MVGLLVFWVCIDQFRFYFCIVYKFYLIFVFSVSFIYFVPTCGFGVIAVHLTFFPQILHGFFCCFFSKFSLVFLFVVLLFIKCSKLPSSLKRSEVVFNFCLLILSAMNSGRPTAMRSIRVLLSIVLFISSRILSFFKA